MPEGYLKIKEKFIKDGMSEEEAATHAARIWNAKHKDNPVTKKDEEPKENVKILDGSFGKVLDED